MGCSSSATSSSNLHPAAPSHPAPGAPSQSPSLSPPNTPQYSLESTAGIDLANPLSPESLMAEIEILASPALHGRGSATPDEQRAAVHLMRQLERAGVEPIGDPPLRMQALSFGSSTSQNVIGIIRPTGDSAASSAPAIVLGAHYDHLGVQNGEVYLGADDNASGTAAVLGVARALVARRGELARAVIIVFFGAEEIGMWGSKAFVTGGPIAKDRMFAMVNVDMVGRPLTDQTMVLPLLRLAGIDPDASVGVEGLRGRPGFEQVVRDACSAEQHRAVTIEDLPKPVRPTVERLSRGRGDNWMF
jgi:peptidase M28-like protein